MRTGLSLVAGWARSARTNPSLNGLCEHDGSLERALQRFDLIGGLVADEDWTRFDYASGRRRPALGVADERHVARCNHLDGQPRQLPAASELEGLELRALEAHRRELLPCPFRRGLVRRRSCQPRSVDGDEAAVELHDLRSLEAFLPNPFDRWSIDGILAGRE